MKNYFISFFEPCEYSKGWYGELDYSPSATMLLYNDDGGFCVGFMERDLPPGVDLITEVEALSFLNSANLNNPNIWMGDRLVHRWDNL